MSRLTQCDKCFEGGSRYARCVEHKVCDECGQATGDLVHYLEGIFCGECWAKRIEKRIKEFKGKTDHTHTPICPYCGHSIGNWWDMRLKEDVDNLIQCSYCDNEIRLSFYVDYIFTTKKSEA
jgi:hypothetical protein